MIAALCAVTGWTWDYVERNIDFPRHDAMWKHYRKHPPTSYLCEGRFGWKVPEEKGDLDKQRANLIKTIGDLGQTINLGGTR